MGLFDRLANLLGLRKKEVNVLVVGLNNSGKSTVINNFKREDDRCIDIVPTVGYNVEKFSCKLNNDEQTTFDVELTSLQLFYVITCTCWFIKAHIATKQNNYIRLQILFLQNIHEYKFEYMTYKTLCSFFYLPNNFTKRVNIHFIFQLL